MTKSTRPAQKSTPVLPKIGTRRKDRSAAAALSDADDSAGLSTEGRLIYSLLLSKLQDKLESKDEKIEQLEAENAALRRDLTRVVERMDSFENRERATDAILSGNSVPTFKHGENLKQVCVELIRSKVNCSIPDEEITSVHRLNGSNGQNRKNILVKFRRPEQKSDLIHACRRVKPDGLYVRDNLTVNRSKILFSLRQLKKKTNRIDHCGSIDGRVFAWIKPLDGNGQNKKFIINNSDVLKRVCTEELEIEPGDVLDGVSME